LTSPLLTVVNSFGQEATLQDHKVLEGHLARRPEDKSNVS